MSLATVGREHHDLFGERWPRRWRRRHLTACRYCKEGNRHDACVCAHCATVLGDSSRVSVGDGGGLTRYVPYVATQRPGPQRSAVERLMKEHAFSIARVRSDGTVEYAGTRKGHFHHYLVAGDGAETWSGSGSQRRDRRRYLTFVLTGIVAWSLIIVSMTSAPYTPAWVAGGFALMIVFVCLRPTALDVVDGGSWKTIGSDWEAD